MNLYSASITQVACYYCMSCFSEYSEFFEDGYEEYEIYNASIKFAVKYSHLIIPSDDADFDRDLFDKILKIEVKS